VNPLDSQGVFRIMATAEAGLMARPKGRPKTKEAPATQTARTTIINLKGSQDQADWLEAAHRKTHIAKSVIVRLALSLWAERNGHPPFPSSEED
jgi:hypothetical protein